MNVATIFEVIFAILKSRRSYRVKDAFFFSKQLEEYQELGGAVHKIYPILFERTQVAGEAKGHYFHQDLLVANYIFQAKPLCHLDVGSRIDGFVAHVATFMPVDVFDIRPIQATDHHNIHFIQADITAGMKPEWINKYDSISCLHALEHFGLGRYGDRLDPNGHETGFLKLLDMLKPGGRLYIGIPIARETRVEFNAHRKFHPLDILNWPTGEHHIELKRFDYVDDAGDLHRNISLLNQSLKLDYGCGIYTFEKSAASSTPISLGVTVNKLQNSIGPRITFLMDPDNQEGAGSFYQRPFLAYLFATHLNLPFVHAVNKHSDVHYQKDSAKAIQHDWDSIFSFLGEPLLISQPCPTLNLKSTPLKGQIYHLPFDSCYTFISNLDRQDRESLLESTRKTFKANLEKSVPHLIPTQQDGTVIALHLRDRSAGDPIPTRRLLPWQMFSVDYGLPDNNPSYYAKLYAHAVNSIIKEHRITKPILQIHSTGKEQSFSKLVALLDPKIEVQFFLNTHPPLSFVAMLYADILIASHSSFSWIPMLMRSGPSYIRKNFRHFLPSNTKIIEEVLLKDKNILEELFIKLNMKFRYWLFNRMNIVRYQD
jgi:hypothetical protein